MWKYVKNCFIQSMLHFLLYIFLVLLEIWEYHDSKNVPLLQ